jgi:transcriptional regulator with XRE-family HTH domain
VIRPRGGTTRGDDGPDGGLAPPADPVGTRLRQAREERGLNLLAVHDRLGRPITQIEALETGNMEALPDEALAASMLRRYATLLGLDGDELADQFSVERESVGTDRSPSATRSTDAVTGVVAAVTAGPDHLRAFTETGEVPRFGNRTSSAARMSGAHDFSDSVGPPTGTFPVVPRSDLRKSRRSVAKARRRMHAPRSLKVVTWVAAGLVLIVGTGIVLLAARPHVLADAHILRVVPAGSAAATGRPNGQGSSGAASAGHQSFPVQPAGSTPSSASFTVATSRFTVVVATSGPCWVQITSSSSPSPLISGVQPGAKVLSYPAVGTMTVEVGSAAVLVGVTIKGKNAFTDAPKTIPFTYTFTPAT